MKVVRKILQEDSAVWCASIQPSRVCVGQWLPLLALRATQMCRKHGLLRLLERMSALRRHLDGMSLHIRQVSLDLQEALDGP